MPTFPANDCALHDFHKIKGAGPCGGNMRKLKRGSPVVPGTFLVSQVTGHAFRVVEWDPDRNYVSYLEADADFSTEGDEPTMPIVINRISSLTGAGYKYTNALAEQQRLMEKKDE